MRATNSVVIRLGTGLILLLAIGATAAGALLEVASLDAARLATSVRAVDGKVDVLLRVQADDERRDVDDLAADAKRELLIRRKRINLG